MRRDVVSKAMAEQLNPQLRRALLQRSISYFREYQKSMVEVVTFDEILEKADPKGGKYYRRVPRKSGKGYTYYYDPHKYQKRGDAHVEGATAARTAIKAAVQKMLDASEGGVELKNMGAIVKRYGASTCSEALKEMQNETGLVYKGGKLSLKKSQTFIARV